MAAVDDQVLVVRPGCIVVVDIKRGHSRSRIGAVMQNGRAGRVEHGRWEDQKRSSVTNPQSYPGAIRRDPHKGRVHRTCHGCHHIPLVRAIVALKVELSARGGQQPPFRLQIPNHVRGAIPEVFNSGKPADLLTAAHGGQIDFGGLVAIARKILPMSDTGNKNGDQHHPQQPFHCSLSNFHKLLLAVTLSFPKHEGCTANTHAPKRP